MAITRIKIIPTDSVETDKIADNTILNADVSPSADIAQSKIENLSTNLGTVTTNNNTANTNITSLCSQNNVNNFNIGLLGFKMATQENLTVFNLVDGVVDEFHDESGTDESEGSNDGGYCATSDFYQNNQAPVAISAGFSMTAVTESDTSTAPASPGNSGTCGSFGTFTVPTGLTSTAFKVWGAAGGAGGNSDRAAGGGGGFTSGTLATTPTQVLHIIAGEGGGKWNPSGAEGGFLGGGQVDGQNYGGRGGGIAGIFAAAKATYDPASTPLTPQIYTIAGAGGGGATFAGGGGGGLQANAGGHSSLEQTNKTNDGGSPLPGPGSYPGVNGGGGSQTAGGQQGDVTETNPGAFTDCGASGSYLRGGNIPSGNLRSGAGGGGYYGGGTGASGPQGYGSGGGGSSYYGHPQISSGDTEDGQNMPFPSPDGIAESGGVGNPAYVTDTGEGKLVTAGEDGFVLLTGTASVGGTSSTTIISNPFTSTSVPTTSRIVVFEENVDTPTLNSDIIASVSRDGGTTYTAATLADSGYITGASGQRILTGQVTISGQPSGQSMRWKLALANNQVKIHGVSLSWA
mgnify:FL=1